MELCERSRDEWKVLINEERPDFYNYNTVRGVKSKRLQVLARMGAAKSLRSFDLETFCEATA